MTMRGFSGFFGGAMLLLSTDLARGDARNNSPRMYGPLTDAFTPHGRAQRSAWELCYVLRDCCVTSMAW